MADEVLVMGRSKEQAQRLLEAAELAGVDPWLVRTTTNGYRVPEAVAAVYEGKSVEVNADGEPDVAAQGGEPVSTVETDAPDDQVPNAGNPDDEVQGEESEPEKPKKAPRGRTKSKAKAKGADETDDKE